VSMIMINLFSDTAPPDGYLLEIGTKESLKGLRAPRRLDLKMNFQTYDCTDNGSTRAGRVNPTLWIKLTTRFN